jgi:hypothetical protein
MTAIFNDLMNGLDEVEAFLAGNKVSVPTNVDVKGIRKGLNMTQAASPTPSDSASSQSNTGEGSVTLARRKRRPFLGC